MINDVTDVKDNFAYRMTHFPEYIGSFLYKKLSLFIELFTDQKNFVNSITKNLKKNTQLYLEESSKPQTEILNFFGIDPGINKFSNKIEGDISKKINSFIGGGSNNCFILPTLKQSLLKVLINVYNINIVELYIPKKFEKCYISNEKSYIIKTISNNKTDCLNKTKLFKNNKNNKNISKIWDNTNKMLKTPDLSINYNYFQILKDSIFPKEFYYHIGGGEEDIIKNKKFIKSINIDLKNSAFYPIGKILTEIITKLNNNKIFLEDGYIKKIQNNIDILKNNENKLAILAQNIAEASKISNIIGSNNKLLNENTLKEYVNEHKILLESSDKLAINLNKAFLKIIELVDKL